MDTMPGMDGQNFDHYDNYNDTGELSQPPSFENTALSMIGIIIFISLYSTLCGICHKNNTDENNELLRNSLIKNLSDKTSDYGKNAENDFCSICLDEFKTKEKIITLDCSHYFHKDCITDWFKKHETCPLCREELL